jgi:hypothetical protein
LELLAKKHSFCRVYIGAVEPSISWYCPVLVVVAGPHLSLSEIALVFSLGTPN